MRHFILSSLFSFSAFCVVAQENQHEKITETIAIDLTVGTTGTLLFPLADYSMNKKIRKGLVLIQLDMGESYVEDINAPFTGEIKVDVIAKKSNAVVDILTESTATLSVDNNKPSAHFIINLLDLTETLSDNEDFLFDELEISVSESTVPSGYYGTAMRLQAISEIEVGLDVSGLTSVIESVEVNDVVFVSKKLANFKWSDSYPFANYEINILRLHNNSHLTQINEQEITTELDWTKAMSFNGEASYDTEYDTKFFTLTLAEGTGYYVFRVRPIGAYYSGGIADERNWGDWSVHDVQGTIIELAIDEVQLPYFYFADPDQDRNWIYNRIFTENSRVKENLNFANGLQQPRQSQTYLPSQDITLVTQTVLDYSGRPTVTTIPIPLAGRVSNYKENLVKASGSNELYQAKHFDDESNYNDPSATVPIPYYDNNENKSIPNDNGYGFTRTIFYNESSNRILKQSGVGETHKIGNGKTTRYLHSTASEDELVALFGDEAPDNESVIKTITIDPNNIASVTYTSKEGNVIATSLAFYQQNTNLTALDAQMDAAIIQDKITKNSKTTDGFISSKRITLLQDNSNFQVSYSIACYEFDQLCQTAIVDCDYNLVISLIKIGANGNTLARQELISENLSSVACENVEGEDYKIISPPYPVFLEAGNYIIEKRLITGNSSITVQENTKNIKNQTEPIVDLISNWLELVEDAGMLQNFNKSLYDLSQSIDNQTLDSFTNGTLGSTFPVDIPASFFTEVYAEYKDQYGLVFNPEIYNPYSANIGENPFSFTLVTPCCVLDIPVKWIPPFDCELAEPTDIDNNNQYDVVNYLDLFEPNNTVENEYFPDFEGYMLAYMSDCVGPDLDFADEQALKDVIYGVYMDGWEIEGTFNMMVYHMLNDKYNTKNLIDEIAIDEEQYDCDILLACWQGQLTRLKNEICTKFNFYKEDGSVNVSNEFDDQHGDDPNQTEPGHDPHFDDNFKGGFFLTRWIAKRKISKKMRDLQLGTESEAGISPEFGQFHLIKEFLECTNYQFAKIITPFDAEPLTQDLNATFSYAVSSTTVPVPLEVNHSVTKSDYFGGTPPTLLVNSGYNYGYIPLNDWNPVKKVKSQAAKDDPNMEPTNPAYFELSDESLFPYIKNPIYAFKYFEYANEGNSSFQSLEVGVCYNDPNDCYKLDANGFIELVNGQPIKIPCCSDDFNPAWNSTGCYADTEYPNLNASMVGYALDGQGVSSKLVVSNFGERGRVVCPYTHTAWSAGQRYTFYYSLKGFRVPSESSGWNETSDMTLTCTDLNTIHQWYVYTGDYETQETQGYEELVHNDMYDAATLSAFYSQISLADGSLDFKYVELDMEKQISACNTDCDNRRGEFRDELVTMLQSKCYQIGGCRTADPATFYIIPQDDIDKMVDAMVAACGSQCNLTTFACAEVPSRLITRSFTSPGYDENTFELKFGMGGFDPAFCDDPNYTYTDATNCTDVDGDGILECDLLDASTGALNVLSWYEYTKLKQVAEWDFDVDMPTMCLDADNNPIPTEDDLACSDCDADPNTYKGDTFVPKDSYELKSTRAPDSNAPNIGDQVKSSTIGINVTIDPETE